LQPQAVQTPVVSAAPSASVSEASAEFATPENTQVYNNPLATNLILEEEDIMPHLPDPPLFHGEADRDNFPFFVHELTMWCCTVKCNTANLDKVKLSGFLAKAFPWESQALDWYEANKDTTLETINSGENELEDFCKALCKALKAEFAHLVGDKEYELSNMTLRVGDNLATFANKFQKLAIEINMDEERRCGNSKPQLSMQSPPWPRKSTWT